MKKTAIIRIIIYSVLIFLLVSVLSSGIAFHRYGGWGRIARIIHEEADLDVLFEFDDGYEDRDLQSAVSGEPVVIDDAGITKIQVDWVSGDVTVVPGDVDSIQLQETAGSNPMVYAVKGGKLEIKFSKKMKWTFGTDMPSKDLTVTVPRVWVGRELEVHSVSADVEIRDVQLEEVVYQGVSGECRIENAKVEELTMQTVSGNVTVNGEIRELSCEGVSADCDLTLSNVPEEISMEGVSGDLRLTLPEDAGFTVELEGINKGLDTDFEVTTSGGKFVAGDGSCQIEIEGVSGSARIRKAQ